MKLATFAVDAPTGPVCRVGAVVDDGLVDLTAAYTALLAEEDEAAPVEVAQTLVPPDMVQFLSLGNRSMDAAREAVTYLDRSAPDCTPDGARLRYNRDEVDLLSPVLRPNSLRDFMVFEEHVENTIGEDIPDVWYETPIYYKGNPDSVIGPGDDVEWPHYSERLDYELELAAVVGQKCRNPSPEEAANCIAGYTIFNDFSARDTQEREMQAMLGPAKGKDFANALGPYLVTPDEFDLESARMTAEVNGEKWSEGTPGAMQHSFVDIVTHAADGETLYPGDVLGSGTVGKGCGLELDRWLKPDDTVALTVEGIGTLENRVVKYES